MELRKGVELFVFDPRGNLVASRKGNSAIREEKPPSRTILTDFLNSIWDGVSGLITLEQLPTDISAEKQASLMVTAALWDGPQITVDRNSDGALTFTAANLVAQNVRPMGVVALTTASGEIDQLIRAEREQVLQLFVVAIVVSIGLSLVLASTIANPLSDLAAAAEIGSEGSVKSKSAARVRIPDLTARPDEIGRLSGALRAMVTALYDRIDSNEQFAADVAHEIKNPLASLRSAISSLRIMKKDEHRDIACWTQSNTTSAAWTALLAIFQMLPDWTVNWSKKSKNRLMF